MRSSDDDMTRSQELDLELQDNARANAIAELLSVAKEILEHCQESIACPFCSRSDGGDHEHDALCYRLWGAIDEARAIEEGE